jgi:hypothetical protein
MGSPKECYTKIELLRIIKRFLKDHERGISINLFADLCGISSTSLKDIFLNETEPLSEYMQRRVNKGYREWLAGEVAIMQNRDNTKFVQYRKDAKPVLQKTTGLQVVNGEIKIKVGVSNKYDYSGLTLDEQLERG